MTFSAVSSRLRNEFRKDHSLRTIQICSGPAGRLEALLNEGAPDAPFAALVCHPHPLGGGTMHNKVVYHAMKVLNAPEWGFRWPVLRFNFRGTGLSEGTHDGTPSLATCSPRIDWLEAEYNLPVVARRLQLWRGHGACGVLRIGSRKRKPAQISAHWLPWAFPPRDSGTPTTIRSSPNAPSPSFFSAAITTSSLRSMNCNRWSIPPPNPKAWCSSPAPITSLPVNSSRCSMRSRLAEGASAMTPASDTALDTLHATATEIFTGALEACNIESAFDRRMRFEGNTLHRLMPDGSGPDTINLSQFKRIFVDCARQGRRTHA